MAATLDDVVAAVEALTAITDAHGTTTTALLKQVVVNTQAAVTALTGIAGKLATNPPGTNPAPGPKVTPKPKGLLGKIGGLFGKLGRGLTGAKGGLGGTIGGGMGAAGKMAGPVGVAAAFAEQLYKAGEAVVKFAYAQEDAIRRLAQISPSQAANVAQLDANRQLRDLETGENTAASGSKMTEAIDRFEEAVRPLEELWQDIKNGVGAGLLEALTTILEPLNWIAKKLGLTESDEEKSKKEEERIKSGALFSDFLGNVVKEQKARQAEARQRMRDIPRFPGDK